MWEHLIWSLILGIISIPCVCTFLGIIPATIGLILGIIAFRRREGGVAIGGIVCSLIGFICSAIVLAILLVGLSRDIKIEKYISSGEYDKAEDLIENASISDGERTSWYYKLYIAQEKYDEAAEEILKYADKEDKIEELSDSFIDDLDEIYKKTSKNIQKKIDDLKKRKADALAAIEEQKKAEKKAKREEEEAKKQAQIEAQKKAEKEEAEQREQQEEEQKKQQENIKKEQKKAIKQAMKQCLADEITRSEYDKIIKDYDEDLVYQQIILYMKKAYKKDTFDISQANEMKKCVELYSIPEEKKNQKHQQFLDALLKKYDEYYEPARFVLNNDVYIDRIIKGDYSPTELYMRRRIDSWLSDLTTKKMYYYANDYVYDDWGGDWGDLEYVIETEEAFSDSGYMYLWLYDTGETMTLQTEAGFERDVPVYEYFTTEQMEKLNEDYTQAKNESDKLADEIIDMINKG